MNKPLLQQIADMILTIPGNEWDFDHIMCGSTGCVIGHAIKRRLINPTIIIKGHNFYFDTFWGSAAEQLKLNKSTFMTLFAWYPPHIKPTREFVHARLQHFIDTNGEISNDFPS